MSLTRDELEKIARLARLELTDESVEDLADKLSGIIEFFNQLSHVDTDDVLPMAHPLEMAQRLRVDQVTEHDQRQKYQQCSKHIEKDLYLVPKVIE